MAFNISKALRQAWNGILAALVFFGILNAPIDDELGILLISTITLASSLFFISLSKNKNRLNYSSDVFKILLPIFFLVTASFINYYFQFSISPSFIFIPFVIISYLYYAIMVDGFGDAVE